MNWYRRFKAYHQIKRNLFRLGVDPTGASLKDMTQSLQSDEAYARRWGVPLTIAHFSRVLLGIADDRDPWPKASDEVTL